VDLKDILTLIGLALKWVLLVGALLAALTGHQPLALTCLIGGLAAKEFVYDFGTY